MTIDVLYLDCLLCYRLIEIMQNKFKQTNMKEISGKNTLTYNFKYSSMVYPMSNHSHLQGISAVQICIANGWKSVAKLAVCCLTTLKSTLNVGTQCVLVT